MEIEDVVITPPPASRTAIYFHPDVEPSESRRAFRSALRVGRWSSLRRLNQPDAAVFEVPPEMTITEGQVPGDEIEWVLIGGTEARGEVDVPLLRLHRPRHEGCEARYGFGSEHSTKASVKFTLGLSVGGEATVSVKATRTYEATESCVEVISRAKLHVGQYEVVVDGAEIARIWRADVVDFDPRVRDPRELAPEHDGCQVPFSEARHLAEFDSDDMRSPTDPASEMEVEMGRTTKASIDLAPSFGNTLKAKLELGLERETSSTTKISAKLKPGARFSVYVPRSGNTMERCWTTD